MSLIDDLREVAPHVPPSHQPTQAEVPGLVGALIGYVEHAEGLLKAAEGGFDDVAQLFAATPSEPAAEPEQPAATPEPEPAAVPSSDAPVAPAGPVL